MPRHLLRRQHPTTEPPDDSPAPQQPRHQRQRLNHTHAHAHIQPQSQFQTPPPRDPLGIPQLHPSSGPIDHAPNPEPIRRVSAAVPAGLFSLFGRGVAGRPPGGSVGDTAGEEEEEGESQLDDEELGDVDDLNGAGMDPEVDEAGLSEGDVEGMDGDEEEEEEVDEVDAELDEEDEDELMQDRDSPLPADLREISSLASWTVSTHKPGCGVAALRSPDHTQYWQSDGPQPHTLTLHFFKLVAIVRIRVYLDFSLDESYTPTKMIFLAGMGGNDLVEFATWEGEGPCGWVDIPLDGVGGVNGGWVRRRRRYRRRKSVRGQEPRQGRRNKGKRKEEKAGGTTIWADESMVSDSENRNQGRRSTRGSGYEDAYDGEGYGHEYDYDDDDSDAEDDDDDDPYAGSVLKAMVIQMRVTENHQNGKDTHVRGFQVFARDDGRRRMGTAPSASADGRVRRHSVRRSLRGSTNDETLDGRADGSGNVDRSKVTGLEEPDWMGDPVIR